MTYFETVFLPPPRFVQASALTLSSYCTIEKAVDLNCPKAIPRKELQHLHIQPLCSRTKLGHNFRLFFLEVLLNNWYDPRNKIPF